MQGGLIVRLIDVVLIILFGFIAISDIQMKRQIRLPGNQKPEKREEPREIIYLIVKILNSGGYELRVEDTVIASTPELSSLSAQLLNAVAQFRDTGEKTIVIIDPEANASIQQTIEVYDICENYGLQKSIDMQVFPTRESTEQ